MAVHVNDEPIPAPVRPPCVVASDDDLLVVVKPPGWNTHSPSPWSGEGIYEWLRHREPAWAGLGIVHRLDKDTGGLMVFPLSPRATRSLSAQFEARTVDKTYLCLTDRRPSRDRWRSTGAIARMGDRYGVVPDGRGESAETGFEVLREESGRWWLAARPRTGRTHQIRVHAAEAGVPLLGDVRYGGTPWHRLALHAAELAFDHPATGRRMHFEAPPLFAEPASDLLRAAFIDPAGTDLFRVLHGAADGCPGRYVDRLGDFALVTAEAGPADVPVAGVRGVYWKHHDRQVGRRAVTEACPRPWSGEAAPDRFVGRENGLRFGLSFAEGYSVGLFIDQRDNRRRLATGHVAGGFSLPRPAGRRAEVLNAFAYTCGFSVAAAAGGARTTSLDLSRKYLEWGRANLALNGIDPADHDFIHGDCFEWLRRLGRKGRRFEVVILDPPTFSRSKAVEFRAGRDYGRLVTAALAVLAPGGVLLASTNAGQVAPEEFVETVRAAVVAGGRRVDRQFYAPQPPDFPVTREEPAHLKTVWLEVG